MTVQILTSELEQQYHGFILEFDKALFYHSLLFRDFLKDFFGFEEYYFIALENGNIVGTLPAFLTDTSLGTCLNSLPFFGSNGGLISYQDKEYNVNKNLLNAFYNLAEEKKCLTSTIINSPFEKKTDIYESFAPDYYDRRIGQITELPRYDENIEEKLLYSFSAFTRRMIRKAQKKSVTTGKDNTTEAIDFLRNTHEVNMKDIGGKEKPHDFFGYIYDNFRFDLDYTIWVAYQDNNPIASLLLFYFNNTVEYYVPAIVKEYRSIQPLSLIIFKAMRDASEKGYKYWNWGGTWPQQEGVYHFKKKWNASYIPYQHYIKVHDRKIFNFSKEELSAAFPYFYVIPYDKLNSPGSANN